MLVQIASLGARFYKERARALPYYFNQRQCSHALILSAHGNSVSTQCTEPRRPANIFHTKMKCLYCWDHYSEIGEEDDRCPCPLPTDGSRCFNPRKGSHCCSQVDEVQNCRQWYYDPTNRFPDKFCAPHCRLDEDDFDLYGQ
jgi:hypothetical protein